MAVRIRRFSVIKTANTVAVIYAILLGIVFGLLGLFFLVGAASSRFGNQGFAFGAGLVALIVAWIVYAIFGWVFAAIGCLLYNWAAGFTGGIEFELTQAPPPGYGQSGPAWGAPPPGAWQYGPSWGANPPTQGQPWTPPPGTPWGPNPPPARPGPAWPVPPQGPGEQSWGGPPDQR